MEVRKARIFLFILLFIFILIAWVANCFPSNSFDYNILQYAQTYDSKFSQQLIQFAQFLAILGGLPGTIIFVSLLVIYNWLKRQKPEALLCIIGLIMTASVAWCFKWIFDRPRPFIEAHFVDTYGSSFPSAHSTYAMMIACMLIISFSSKKFRWVWGLAIVWVILMGWSRVFLGVHYPTDVLAGWCLAAFIMLMLQMNLQRSVIKNI